MPLHNFSTTVKRSGSKVTYTLAPAPARIPRRPIREDGFAVRSKLPPKSVRLTTVSLCGRKRNSVKHSKKVSRASTEGMDSELDGAQTCNLSLEECMQTRPPLQLDLTGPKPTSYDPPKVFPWETKSPAFTMRPKTQPEKDVGGDRVSWGKQWFASPDIWTLRAKFDLREPWPSPACYKAIPAIGFPQASLPQSPSHSIARRQDFVINKRGSENEPAPNQYDYDRSKRKTLTRFPSYTIQQGRRGGTALWSAREPVPGPGTYNPKVYVCSSKRVSPAYSWSRGERRIGITQNCTF